MGKEESECAKHIDDHLNVKRWVSAIWCLKAPADSAFRFPPAGSSPTSLLNYWTGE